MGRRKTVPVNNSESKTDMEAVKDTKMAKVVDAKSGLRFRKEPSTNAEVIGLLLTNRNDLIVLEEGKEWTKVSVSDKVGYVMSKYIEVI